MGLDLALVLHAHQPAGNFDGVVEEAYALAYQPFLAAAARRPWLKLNLHFSGFLLDWLAERHPEFIAQLRGLLATGQLEILGGGYYEPILAVIPAADQQAQCRLLQAAVERHLGVTPRGAWLAERVWEQSLTGVLAQAGFDYTLLDDAHFVRAGVAPDDCHGFWITEDQGRGLRLVPSSFFLRQALPFKPAPDALAWLCEQASQHPGALFTMGDDLEKFGAWPHTHQHVYTQGWLEQFLDQLEASGDQIHTVRLSDVLTPERSRGLLYLPTGSYPEMMEWAGSPSWRGFFTRYPEANLMHKRLWDVYQRSTSVPPDSSARAACDTARLAAECNDAYWHGWFGGLYTPHLRNQVWTRLLEAERHLESASPVSPLRRWDLDGDGLEEIEMNSRDLRLLLTPADGGTLAEFSWRPADANLLNSLQRRPETYHEQVRQNLAANPANLPGETGVSNHELQQQLQYDRYARASARVHLCPAAPTFAAYLSAALDEDAATAAGRFGVTSCQPGRIELRGPGPTWLGKIFRLQQDHLALEILPPAGVAGVVEFVWNLLAPRASDRWIQSGDVRHSLDWTGEICLPQVSFHDGWRGCDVALTAPGARAWWVQPIHTISQAERGLESIYQGTAVAAVFGPECAVWQITVAVQPSGA